MRILMVCRLMSGFEESLRARRWKPTGSPAVARLIERLDNCDVDFRLVLTRARGAAGAHDMERLRGRNIRVEGLSRPVTLLASGPRLSGSAGYYCRELLHALRLLWTAWRWRPDVIYADRSNVLVAGVLARLGPAPVVLRLLGVPPDSDAILTGRRFGERLFRWAYHAPFAHVICSMDGSGGGSWMDKALRSGVPREVVLNGVDPQAATGAPPKALDDLPRDRAVIALIGRVERLKGADFFVDAMLALPQECRERAVALVAGDGELLAELKKKVAEAGASDLIRFTGALPREQVAHVLQASDIYVSLNLQGHLSNANLEAMSAGLCLVIRRNSADGSSEAEFDALLPEGCAERLPKNATPAELGQLLCRLVGDGERRTQCAQQMTHALAGKLRSWEHRIDHEVAILTRAAGGAA